MTIYHINYNIFIHVFLQLVRDQINEFSVRQLVYIYNLISRSDAKLQTAIKNAIPIILDITLKNENDATVLQDLSVSELIMVNVIAISPIISQFTNFQQRIFYNLSNTGSEHRN